MTGNIGTETIRQMAIGLTICFGLSACAVSTESRNAQNSITAAKKRDKAESLSGNSAIPLVRRAGEGNNYEWGKDHIFVKLSNAETGGVLTLIQDNLKPGFKLGLHLHRTHTEIFYILAGEVEFTIGKEPLIATQGAVVYIPAGTPHAATSSKGGKMLMFYSPGGFDEMLAEIDSASWFQRLNPFAGARRNAKYDIHQVSEGSQPTQNGSGSIYVAPGEGTNPAATAKRVVKLNSAQTGSFATVVEETFAPGVARKLAQQRNQLQILYVLGGEVEFSDDGNPQVATKGATIYFPAGSQPQLKSASGAKVLVFKNPAGTKNNN